MLIARAELDNHPQFWYNQHMNTQNALNSPVRGTLAEEAACEGLLFVLVGPSGVGKNTIMKPVMELIPQLRQMPTATTRAIRASEQQGREHWFVSSEMFQAMIDAHAFVEYQEVDPGKFYGTPRHEIEDVLRDQHEMLIADIEVNGAEALKSAFPEHVILIYIQPPSVESLNVRLHQRGGMSEEEIQTRLARAVRELAFAEKCDYRVVNNNLEQSVSEVARIITDEGRQHGCL